MQLKSPFAYLVPEITFFAILREIFYIIPRPAQFFNYYRTQIYLLFKLYQITIINYIRQKIFSSGLNGQNYGGFGGNLFK